MVFGIITGGVERRTAIVSLSMRLRVSIGNICLVIWIMVSYVEARDIRGWVEAMME